MKNEVLSCLETRRSCRSFRKEQVKDEELNAILEAGLFAPSGMNRQSTVIVVVKDEDTLAVLRRLNAEVMAGMTGDPFYGAPEVLVVLADKRVMTCVEDGSLVMGNLLNAAESVGVAACWIHRARETFETKEGRALLERWGLDDNYIGIGNCIIGYAEGDGREAAPRRPGRIIFDRM